MRNSLAYLAVSLLVAEVAVVVFSWIASVVMPSANVASMLSQENIRWFVGQYTDFLSTRVLINLLCLALAYGIWHRSRLGTSIVSLLKRKSDVLAGYRLMEYSERVALQFAIIVFVVEMVVILSTILMPHAILLNALGDLWPSSFMYGLLPICSFVIGSVSLVYAVIVNRIQTARDFLDSMTYGINKAAPLIVVYLLAAQLYVTLLHVVTTA